MAEEAEVVLEKSGRTIFSEWTGLSDAEATNAARCRDGWRGLVREAVASSGPLQRHTALREQ